MLFKTPFTKRKRTRKSPEPKSTCQSTGDSVNKTNDTEYGTAEDSDIDGTVSRNKGDHQGVYIRLRK